MAPASHYIHTTVQSSCDFFAHSLNRSLQDKLIDLPSSSSSSSSWSAPSQPLVVVVDELSSGRKKDFLLVFPLSMVIFGSNNLGKVKKDKSLSSFVGSCMRSVGCSCCWCSIISLNLAERMKKADNWPPELSRLAIFCSLLRQFLFLFVDL